MVGDHGSVAWGICAPAAHLDDVPAAAREAIALMLDIDPADVGTVEVHVQGHGCAKRPYWCYTSQR